MTLRRRTLRYLRQLVNAHRDPDAISRIEDPERLLQIAQEQMTTMHARNRERAVQAITQKNNLVHMVADAERRVAALHEDVRVARERGDEDRASQFLREQAQFEELLATSKTQLELAIQTSEDVKRAIRREEDRIRRQVAEMTALRTQWKLVQIERALTISLAQLTAAGNAPATRERVAERHQLSREMAIEAVAQKNHLVTIAQEAKSQAERLRHRADVARRDGEEELETLLLRELEQQEGIRAATDAALARANAVTTRARTLLAEEAARVQVMQSLPPASRAMVERREKSLADADRKPRTFVERNGLLLVALCVTAIFILWWLLAWRLG